MKRESCVLCEGYHDRAFWSGLLLHLGCTDPGHQPVPPRKSIADPWGLPVKGGQFAFRSRSGEFIRVVPVGGRSLLLPILRYRLTQRDQKPLVRLVINVDSDLHADGTPSVAGELQPNSVLQAALESDPAAQLSDPGDIIMDGGDTLVSLCRWVAPHGPTAGMPNQQTLERVLSSAFHAVYPDRSGAVQRWLDGRPHAPAPDPKEHAFSYLAGWHAACGSYEAFCSKLWDQPDVVQALRTCLEHGGVWRVAEALAE